MERGNTKLGPAHDEQMAHETEGMVRGSAQRPHGEEWRETEPVENAVPPPRRAPGGNPRPESRDIELRSELARVVSRDFFPADRDELLGRLADTDTPPDLAERIAMLPAGHSYTSRHDVLVALGISSPESRG
jgi:hypothetical protein